MSRIDDIFAQLKANNHKGLMPFVCAGFPQPQSTEKALAAMQRAGASMVEVGFPFSDPIADGPVIAAAMHAALEQGSTPVTVFEQVAAARPQLSLGLIAMVSISIVHRMGGGARFCGMAKEATFDGLIVPDLPVEEAGPIVQEAAKAGLSCSFMIAPTTPPNRIAEIAKACTGFVYLVARTGITGEQAAAPEIAARVAKLREATTLPIACGFGISTPDHVRAVVHGGGADAAIVGSALVRRMAEAAEKGDNPANAAEHFVRFLGSGLRA